MRRVQIILVGSTVALSWLLMMAVHELGHVLHAGLSGGRVTAVILHPLAISRTDVTPNPHLQFVAWGGAIWGTALPVLALLIVRYFGWRYAYLVSFFAGFCCVANGAYLAAGSLVMVGDAADLMRVGVPPWFLVSIGLPLCGIGLYLWNGLGKHFGLGADAGEVNANAAATLLIILVVVVVVEMCVAWYFDVR